MTSPQHIYFCADRKYLPCTAATMASILANATPDSKQVFHLISDDITPEDINTLRQLESIKHCQLLLHTISAADFSQYKMDFGYLSMGALYRLKLLDFIPEDSDKALYLDGDMTVTGPLDELFAEDLGCCFAGVVEEKGAFQTQNLGLKSGRYFNSGMILFNLPALKDYDLVQKGFAYYKQNQAKIISHDQDILNGIWDGKVKFIEQKYNVPSFVKHFKNPLIIHYTGFVKKPWHAYCRHPLKNEWLKYAQMTPYKRSPARLLLFKLRRFASKIFYFCKDPTHKRYYILCLFGMNFGLGKKDNKRK